MRLRSSGAAGLLCGVQDKRGLTALEKAEQRAFGGRFLYNGIGLRFARDHKGGGLVALKAIAADTEVAIARGELVGAPADKRVFYVESSKCARAAIKSKLNSAETLRPRSLYLRLFSASRAAGWGNLVNTEKLKKNLNCRLVYSRGKSYCTFRTTRPVMAGEELLADYGSSFKGSLERDPSFKKKKPRCRKPPRWQMCETCGKSFPPARFAAHIKGHQLNGN